MFTYRRGAKGFTLVEIMIVVAIIALIAAIGIPNLLRARHNANEGAAVGNLHTLVSAMESWRANHNPTSYPTAAEGLAALGSATPPYIDGVLSTGTRQGYVFTYVFGTANTYTLSVAPVTAGVTGTRGFFADESGVLRASVSGAATVASPALD